MKKKKNRYHLYCFLSKAVTNDANWWLLTLVKTGTVQRKITVCEKDDRLPY